MYNPYDEGPSLNRFLLISVVLHAIVFLTFPNLYSLLESDVPGMAGGGIIQVMHVETSSVSQLSPVTDRKSESSIPKVTEPRPLPEEEVQETAMAQPQPEEIPEPKSEQSPPLPPEQPAEPPQEEEIDAEPDPTSTAEEWLEESEGDLLTSEFGEEIVLEDDRESLELPEQTRPKPEPMPAEMEASGTGEGGLGEDDEAGISQSGEGLEENSPPPPGPPPSGFSLHLGGGSPVYPKDAEHEGVEGKVTLKLQVSSSGELIDAIIVESSGDARLDLQSQRTVKANWSFKPEDYGYELDLEILFAKKEDGYETEAIYGETRWLNAP
ncbi:MAG: TonB family protein [Firmicutes bacterium]|nr:TonB family protein [Bacillota bacterium]